MARSSIVIVGGGISGLAAAWELVAGERTAPSGTRVEIVEASPRVGGSLSVTTFAGRSVDRGPDGFLSRRPEVVDLVTEMGLAGELEAIAASGASLFLGGEVQPLPEGTVLGLPTSAKSLRRLRGLSHRARYDAWRDEHFARSLDLEVDADASIGQIVRTKLGDEIALSVVEPMIGGIQAGRIDDLSAEAIFPGLLVAARQGGSLMRAIAPAPASSSTTNEPAPASPMFSTLLRGVGSLPDELETQLRERGVIFTLSTAVTALRRSHTSFYRWEVDTATTTTPANAVIVATPPQSAGRLLGDFDESFLRIGEMMSASSAMVTYCVPNSEVALPENGTGVLIPLGTAFGDSTMMVTALTFLDRKWPHLADGSSCLVRAHVGRIDDVRSASMNDAELVARVTDEIAHVLGAWPIDAPSMVVRHDGALPQYTVGHVQRVSAAKIAAAKIEIALAGNAYDGVGIPASVGSGRRAAREVLDYL